MGVPDTLPPLEAPVYSSQLKFPSRVQIPKSGVSQPRMSGFVEKLSRREAKHLARLKKASSNSRTSSSSMKKAAATVAQSSSFAAMTTTAFKPGGV